MRLLLPVSFLLIAFIVEAQSVQDLIDQGIRLHDAGEYDKAIEKYEAALQLEPGNGNAYYEIAYSYKAKKDLGNALQMAEKAIQYANDNTRILAKVVYGSLLDEMGKARESVAFLEQSLKEHPNNYLILFNLGVTLAGLGRARDAENAFQQALANKPGHPGSHLQLGNLNLRRDAKAKASMSYYFFLMLENQSQRADDVSKKLLTMLYGLDSVQNKVINITLPSKGQDDGLGPAEVFFATLGVTSAERNTKKGAVSKQQRFVNDTESYFRVLSEMTAPTRKRKKKSAAVDSFWTTTYISFYSDLLNAGHVEAFCYHIMAGQKDEEVTSWISSNKEKMDRFYLWVKTR